VQINGDEAASSDLENYHRINPIKLANGKLANHFVCVPTAPFPCSIFMTVFERLTLD